MNGKFAKINLTINVNHTSHREIEIMLCNGMRAFKYRVH